MGSGVGARVGRSVGFAVGLLVGESVRVHVCGVRSMLPMGGEQYMAAASCSLAALLMKHLGTSIEEPGFWEASCAIVERKIDAFEGTMNELGM